MIEITQNGVSDSGAHRSDASAEGNAHRGFSGYPACDDRTNLSAGAARGIRTPDPVITNDVLYRLSYCGEPCRARTQPTPIRAHVISGTARIGKDKRQAKCCSGAPAGPESAPTAGLSLCLGFGRAYLFRKFIARTVVIDSGIIRRANDWDDGLDRGLCRLAEIGAGPEHRGCRCRR